MTEPAPWLLPPAWDGTARSHRAHAVAIGALERGAAKLWLGPFDPPAALPAAAADGALVVPTSGSTGAAKAVLLSREALIASQDATASVLGGHGAWLPLLPPTHIAGVQVLARAWRTALLDGPAPGGGELPATLPVVPDLAGHFDAAAFLAAAEQFLAAAPDAMPRYTSLVPTQLMRIVTGTSGDAARARGLLARFDAVLVGGAATDQELLARARAARIRVRTTYGSSETAGGCVYDGDPLPGVRLRIADPDEQRAGRLRIISPTLALGHLSADGRLLREGFDSGPEGEELTTSDLAELDEQGRLTVHGRADDVIVTGGRKVHPRDVERALERSLMLRDLVTGSVAVGVPDPEWGQRLEVLVTLAPGLDPAEAPSLVRAALRTSEVPSHHVPRRVHVVPRLPLLGIGKIDRAAARRIAGDS